MVSRRDILAEARTWIGTPYHHQGRAKGVGVDCCGVIIGLMHELGLSDYDIDGYSRFADGVGVIEEFDRACTSIAIEDAQPGDIYVFRISHHPSHCGILSEIDGKCHLIHAYQSIDRVVEHGLDDWWSSRIVAAYAFPGVH